jgi:2-polyprenyl-3-methyl-5-hydroxy-6-metoxy-1,4-benzoquinol methylase
MQDQIIERKDLEELFRLKYGTLGTTGWGPHMQYRFRYFTPDDYYEIIVAKFVDANTEWLDVGCGRNLFPDNESLAYLLADRCQLMVGVDPDDTLEENPYVHERVKSTLQDYYPDRTFNLITLRMVAEHITVPQTAVRALARLTRPGGE